MPRQTPFVPVTAMDGARGPIPCCNTLLCVFTQDLTALAGPERVDLYANMADAARTAATRYDCKLQSDAHAPWLLKHLERLLRALVTDEAALTGKERPVVLQAIRSWAREVLTQPFPSGTPCGWGGRGL